MQASTSDMAAHVCCHPRQRAVGSMHHRRAIRQICSCQRQPERCLEGGSAADRRCLLMASGAALLLREPCSSHARQPVEEWSSPGLGAPVDPNQPRFSKTPSGVKLQELALGSGPAAEPGSRVLLDYVVRRSNGYFIYSTVEGVSFQPRSVPTEPLSFCLGKHEVIQGLEELVQGMQAGGKRRAIIPKEAGYVHPDTDQPQPPTFSAKRQILNHAGEFLLFEVQLLRVRPEQCTVAG